MLGIVRTLLAAGIVFGLLAVPAQAHRLNWLPVREVALAQVQESASHQPEAVSAGIASRCWRRGNHRVGCPVFMRIDHTDELGFVRHLNCTGTVEAVADPESDYVEWTIPDLPCSEIGPPPVPTPEQLQAFGHQSTALARSTGT